MTTKQDRWRSRLHLVVKKIKQYFCEHIFIGVDMVNRDSRGLVMWPCSKCGKVYEVEYGLNVPGKITGPWASQLLGTANRDTKQDGREV